MVSGDRKAMELETHHIYLNEGLENPADQVEYKGMKIDLFFKKFFKKIRQ